LWVFFKKKKKPPQKKKTRGEESNKWQSNNVAYSKLYFYTK